MTTPLSVRRTGVNQRVGTYGSYNEGHITNPPERVATTDATATVISSFPLAVGEAVNVAVKIVGMQTDASNAVSANLSACFRRQAAGNVTQVGTTQGTVLTSSTATVAFNANTGTQTVEIKVTGVAATNYRWECVVDRLKLA